MEKVNENLGETLWLLTDREFKTLYTATGAVTEKLFNSTIVRYPDITYRESEELWFLIDNLLDEDEPDG